MKIRMISGWALLPTFMLVAVSAFAGPPTAISDCDTSITEPGKYRLVNDLYCDAGVRPIQILASDVKLDLHGHSINCAAGDRSGVVVGSHINPEVFSNVRISNGSINGCAVGALLWFTDGARVTQISFSGSTESGVTLVEAQNNAIRNNRFEGDFWAISSYAGNGNQYAHNAVQFSFLGIDLYGETDSRINCNLVGHSFYTLTLGPSGDFPSSGNLVRGNLVTDSFLGITLYGVGTLDDGLFEPQSTDNLIHANVVTGNVWDMLEAYYDPFADSLYVDPEAECQNTWKNNQFNTEIGPPGCIGTPVYLEEVCAFDEEDD